jgi:MtN3 and saliva related transmembrane protein
MNADWIGWAAAVVLLATLSRQVYHQWRDESARGISRWLFVGQLASSTGFIIYSYALKSWVFVVTNCLILLVAAVGQSLTYFRKRTATGNVANNSAARMRRPPA